MKNKRSRKILFYTYNKIFVNLRMCELWPAEVQIAVQQVGICGSDVKYWKEGAIGHFVVTKPLLLGHEISGVISRVGEGVTHLKIGKT